MPCDSWLIQRALQPPGAVKFGASRLGGPRARVLLLFGCAVGLLAAGPTLTAKGQATAGQAPGRKTTDREADLIEACLQAGYLEDAETICQRELKTAAPGTLDGAVWAMRMSAVTVAKLRNSAEESDAQWELAVQPLQDALRGYEDQPAAPWLELQRLLVGLSQAELRSLLLLANPADQQLRERFAAGLRSTLTDLRALEAKLDELMPLAPRLRADLNDNRLAHANDLLQLQRTTRRRITAGLLLQSKTFAEGSADALAAATDATRAARRMLESLPADSAQRMEVVRMLARATRLSGEARQAAALLAPPVREGVADAATVAEWLRAELQLGNRDLVRRWLADYYGDSPQTAPRSLELDLTRLQWLISEMTAPAGNQNYNQATAERQITDWVTSIGRRNGAYGRRLGESVMLRSLRANPEQANATLLAAQAGQLVRSGDAKGLLEAANLFQQASQLAANTSQPDEAFRFGVQAAACWYKAERNKLAADQFAAIARQFPRRPSAERIHLESARILSELIAAERDRNSLAGNSAETNATTPPSSQQQLVGQLEATLIDQLLLWPSGEKLLLVREWASKLFAAADRPAVAAMTTLRLPPDAVEWPAAIEQAGILWRQSLLALPSGEPRAAWGAKAIAWLDFTPSPQLSSPQPTLDTPETTASDPNRRAENQTAENQTAGQEQTESDQIYIDRLSRGLQIGDAEQQARLRQESALLAALTLSPSALKSYWIAAPEQQSVGDASPQAFAHDLRRVRIDGINPEALALSPPALPDRDQIELLALERLHEDARNAAELRSLLGRAMLRISATGKSTASETLSPRLARRYQLIQADALAWSGDWQAAFDKFTGLLSEARQPGEVLSHAGETLANLGNPAAAAEAVKLWNRYATGLPPGSDRWHQAKLATAAALRDAGDSAEASKLARYILLTSPPTSAELRNQYQRFAEQAP
ncbi:hypothetical protein SH139x_003318 [Planctomycetaceae bacterium SH139]